MSNQPADEQIFRSWETVLFNRHDPLQAASFFMYFGIWQMFNAVYRQDSQVRLASPARASERDRVESFAHADAFGNTHVGLLVADNQYLPAVRFVAQRTPPPPAWIGQGCVQTTVRIWNLDQRLKDKPQKQGHCVDQNDLGGLLGCLYVTRCNLFHASKAVGNELDVQLMDNASTILGALIRRYNFR